MRYSRQRNIVLDIVKNNHVHPTAEWVYEKAKEQLPQIGIATVYRNLNALSENGDILRISTVGGPDRFDGNTMAHYHMRCRKCRALTDIPPKDEDAAKRMEENIRHAFHLDPEMIGEVSINTTLFEGFCGECREEMKRDN